MTTVLKIQLPINKSNPFAIAYNNKGTFRELINVNQEKDLINQIFKKKEFRLAKYCKCEVKGSKIIKVLEQVSEEDFILEDN